MLLHAKYFILLFGISACALSSLKADNPQQGDVIRAFLGKRTALESVYIPPGDFMMGSTLEEKRWATGIEGGAPVSYTHLTLPTKA